MTHLLSPSEKKVFELVVKGLSNLRVANILGVSEKTVKFHLTNIFAKTKLKSRAELIASQNRKENSVHIDELKIFKTLLNM